MEPRRLGSTGLEVSPLCLGAMNFGDPTDAESRSRIIDAALDAGINFIDTADVYAAGESEQIVGAALAANGKRDEVVLATKVGMPRGEGDPPDSWHRREHIVAVVRALAGGLQTDHIDLYQLHRPSFADVPQEETLGALDDLVQAGKVRYIGCSTHPGLDGDGGARGRPSATAAALRERAAALQPARPAHRERAAPAVPKYGLACCRGRRWPAGSWPAATPTGSPTTRARRAGRRSWTAVTDRAVEVGARAGGARRRARD